MYQNMIVIDRQARESLQMQIRRRLACSWIRVTLPRPAKASKASSPLQVPRAGQTRLYI